MTLKGLVLVYGAPFFDDSEETPKMKKLSEAPDSSTLNRGDNLFEPWPGDPFVGMPRKVGQLDHECAACGNTVRHLFYPDVPRGWWWFHDAATDIVHVVCKPTCAAELSQIDTTGFNTINALVQALVTAGWHYRRPEKSDKSDAKGLGGGWGKGSL